MLKHQLIIKETKINIHVKRCPICEESFAIMVGNKSRKCMDCIKQGKYPERHIPKEIISYTNVTLYTAIREGKIQRLNVMRVIPQVTRWTIIKKE